jgi:hypothetical protein
MNKVNIMGQAEERIKVMPYDWLKDRLLEQGSLTS